MNENREKIIDVEGSVMRLAPHVRILATERCSFACRWCVPGGEGGGRGHASCAMELTAAEIASAASILAETGVRCFKLSGGEPAVRRDIIQIVSEIKKNSGISRVEMVTRDPGIVEYAEGLCGAGLDGITFSLDSTDERTFRYFTRYKGSRPLKEIYAAMDIFNCGKVPVKINVIPQRLVNKGKFALIADVAAKYDAELKFIDLMTMDREWWLRHYVPINEVIEELEGMILLHIADRSYQPGMYGTPMKQVVLKNGVKVSFRDSMDGTHYGSVCEGCFNYPCQDGLMALRLTPDGNLKTCLYRNDNLIPLTALHGQRKTALEAAGKVVSIFRKSEFKKLWSPEIEMLKTRNETKEVENGNYA